MAQENAAPQSPCRLQIVANDPLCDFKSPPGPVTLKVNGTKGSVQFQLVKLNGTSIPGMPNSQVTLTLIAGKNKIDVVYVFSDPANGIGELRESCESNTLLDTVKANNPAVQYRVCP